LDQHRYTRDAGFILNIKFVALSERQIFYMDSETLAKKIKLIRDGVLRQTTH
jgi:hypothetical protein